MASGRPTGPVASRGEAVREGRKHGRRKEGRRWRRSRVVSGVATWTGPLVWPLCAAFSLMFFFFFNKLDDFLLHRYLFCLLDMGWVRVGREGGGRPVCFGSAMDSSSVDYDLVACVSSLMNIHPRFFFRRVPCCQCTTSVVCSVGRRGEGEAAGEQVLRKRVRGGEGMSRTHTSCEDPCATRPDLI